MKLGPQLLALCKDALAAAGESEAEVWVRERRRGCARFAISELSQHMALDEAEARVRVARGKRVAEVASSALDARALAETIREAARLAALAPEQDGFSGFADAGAETPSVPRWAESTAAASDELRAEAIAKVLARIGKEGLAGAGMLETSAHGVAIATTRGCTRHHDGTHADLRIWALEDATGRGASGHAHQLVRDVRALDVDARTDEAIRFAKLGKAPQSVDAGSWDIVMEPVAVAELLEWLSNITFSAPDVEQGTSILADGLGKRITGEAIDLVEDPLDASELGFADPFDREGVPRRRVELVAGGIGKAVLYDRVHAARANAKTTGSAVLSGFGAPAGVSGVAVQLGGGTAASVDELVAGTKRGLYIRRLHYVNGYLDPKRAVMTGLSRDGCFLVEDGRPTTPVGNVRLTDSFLEMLARADGMTKARTAITASWVDGANFVVPAIRFRGVRITTGSKR